MARFYFGDRDPLGQTFAFFSEQAEDAITVVGLVEDTHQMNLREAPPRTVYTPLAQAEPQSPSWMNFEIRTAQSPAAARPAASGAARARQQGRGHSLRADDGSADQCVAGSRAAAGHAVGGLRACSRSCSPPSVSTA